MKLLTKYILKVFATGFIILVLFSLLLFWGRELSSGILRASMCYNNKEIKIRPSGLVPINIERGPNVVEASYAVVGPGHVEKVINLGISDYFKGRYPGRQKSNVHYYNKHSENILYFDNSTGLIVSYRYYNYDGGTPDKSISSRKLYVGPDGISETPDKELGCFINPIVNTGEAYGAILTLYDKKLYRFFSIRFDKKIVMKGPKLSKNGKYKPIQIGDRLDKNPDFISASWLGPRIKPPKSSYENTNAKNNVDSGASTIILHPDFRWARSPYILVLDETGRIDLLDKETLEFSGQAGHLMGRPTRIESEIFVKPDDLLSYQVCNVAFSVGSEYGKYAGIVVAGLSREGTALELTVFDNKGRLIRRSGKSSLSSVFNVPWGPFSVITKYMFENLQPLALNIASYFTGSSFEATAGHRGLFILPNSFISMVSKKSYTNEGHRIILILLLMLPSILLGILLGWLVSKDASRIGFSENARLCWIIGTFLFGLSGYIAYRLTRPKEVLVTCQNCGKMRRPDMTKCHCCGSKWFVPELVPPGWRVVD